jgi:hypothetical protein
MRTQAQVKHRPPQKRAATRQHPEETRSRMLRASLTDVVFKPGTREYKVVAGTLADPYTGQVLHYSVDAPDTVHVDHLVALARGWDAGAWSWNPNQRIAFANDPENLIVVSAEANMLECARVRSAGDLSW